MNSNVNEVSMLITIVERGKSRKVVKKMKELGFINHQTLLGKGTAPKEIFDILGVTIEKDIIISVVEKNKVNQIYEMFNKELKFNKPGRGISVSIPISSVVGISTLNELLGKKGA